MLSDLLSPYGLLLRVPAGERYRIDTREQLRYVDVAVALHAAVAPAERMALLIERAVLDTTAGRLDAALSCLESAAADARKIGPESELEVLYQLGRVKLSQGGASPRRSRAFARVWRFPATSAATWQAVHSILYSL